MKIRIFQDSETASSKAADLIARLSQRYTRRKGIFVLALSGGATPRKLYEYLGSGRYHNLCDWDAIHIFQVDERFVPSTHRDSNFRLLRKTLFLPASIPETNIHPVPTEAASLSEAASRYEKAMEKFFRLPSGKLPAFHCILLGIGEDGHTASLFPGDPVFEEQKRFALPVENAYHPHPRITLSLPVLNHSENIIFLVSGKKKASVVRKVLREEDPSLPASLVRPAHRNLFFYLDRDAASLLS
ncbi:MAG: 6-phosphogluconolactonase [Nitrospirota bacterium]